MILKTQINSIKCTHIIYNIIFMDRVASVCSTLKTICNYCSLGIVSLAITILALIDLTTFILLRMYSFCLRSHIGDVHHTCACSNAAKGSTTLSMSNWISEMKYLVLLQNILCMCCRIQNCGSRTCEDAHAAGDGIRGRPKHGRSHCKVPWTGGTLVTMRASPC